MDEATINKMSKLLYGRWARLFAWGAMGMIEWTPEVSAQFTTAYATYKQFQERHGKRVLEYGVVTF